MPEFHDRRADDKRIAEIYETVKEINKTLGGEQGICVRVSVCEKTIQSTQAELKEHKDDSKENKNTGLRIIDIILAIAVFVLAFLGFIKK